MHPHMRNDWEGSEDDEDSDLDSDSETNDGDVRSISSFSIYLS